MCCHNSTPATAIRNAIGGATGTSIGAVDWHYLNKQVDGGRSFANKAAVAAGVNSLADSLSMGDQERNELLNATGNSNVTERMLAIMVTVTKDGLPHDVTNRPRRSDKKIVLATVIPTYGVQAEMMALTWGGKNGVTDKAFLEHLLALGAEKHSVSMTATEIGLAIGVSENTVGVVVTRMTVSGWLTRTLVSKQISGGRRQQKPSRYRIHAPAALIEDTRELGNVLSLIEGKINAENWTGSPRIREVLRAIQALAFEGKNSTVSCPGALLAEKVGISRATAKLALSDLVTRGFITQGTLGADYRLAPVSEDYRLELVEGDRNRGVFNPTQAVAAHDIFNHYAGFPHKFGAVLGEIYEQGGSNEEISARSGYSVAQVKDAVEWAVDAEWVTTNSSGHNAPARGINLVKEMNHYAAQFEEPKDETSYLPGFDVVDTDRHSMVGVARRRGLKHQADSIRDSRRSNSDDGPTDGRFTEDKTQDSKPF